MSHEEEVQTVPKPSDGGWGGAERGDLRKLAGTQEKDLPKNQQGEVDHRDMVGSQAWECCGKTQAHTHFLRLATTRDEQS